MQSSLEPEVIKLALRLLIDGLLRCKMRCDSDGQAVCTAGGLILLTHPVSTKLMVNEAEFRSQARIVLEFADASTHFVGKDRAEHCAEAAIREAGLALLPRLVNWWDPAGPTIPAPTTTG